ncbi:MAG: hypothetical protein MJE68_32540, partial [Proteobacteria bacterium]|nr:hypothetical protein [Pseudomonadota bacterium]
MSLVGEHIPTSAPQRWSSAAMFNFEEVSGEKGAWCSLPTKSAALAQGHGQWPLLGQDPSKKNFAGERYHRLSQAGEHVPTSVPQWRSSATMVNFEGVSGEKCARCG